MIRLIYRFLSFDLVRTSATVFSIAAVIAVILVLEGFNEGLISQLGDVAMDRQADLIVTQAGVSNMIAARSTLPQFARGDVEAVAGVAAAHPLTGIPVIYSEAGLKTPIFLFVYDESGGPTRIVSGQTASRPRDIVVDRSLALKHGLQTGDLLRISGFEFRISGISEDSAAFFTPFAFARYDDLIDFYLESDIAADISAFPLLSFLLVKLSPDADREAVSLAIEEAVPDGDVHFPEALAARDESLGRVLFSPVLRLLIDVSYVIGVLVTGIIMFSGVNERRRELGVLKALGFSHRYLSASVVVEALIVVSVAMPIGMLVSTVVADAIELSMPLYRVLPGESLPVFRTLAACVVFAVAGAAVPVRLLRDLDPDLVFRG